MALTKSKTLPYSNFSLYLLTYLLMDVGFIKICFLNLLQNEINTLNKLELSDIISLAVGFIFLITGCFLQE